MLTAIEGPRKMALRFPGWHRKSGTVSVDQSFDAYVEALILASRSLDKDAQASLAKEFFHQVSNLSLSDAQGLEAWEKILDRRDRFIREGETPPPFHRLVLEHFLTSDLLREPVITEFAEIQRLRSNALVDPLTGLQNRRLFDERLEREMDAAVRYAQEFSLVLLDLNRFKEVNDAHGHATGDKVLAVAGRLIGESARSSDLTFRIGGDEFALLLPRTAYDGAKTVADRLRERFAEAVLPLDPQIPVSLAYGIATAPREARAASALFALADERLYNFKRSIGSPRCAPRTYPRIHLANTDAYAVLQWDSGSHRAQVVDFTIGGVGLKLGTPLAVPHEFLSKLFLPRLHPLVTRVHKVFETIDPSNIQRLGCAFLAPEENHSPKGKS
jgi:diguanylate cyclase (GGDEF)-like protein